MVFMLSFSFFKIIIRGYGVKSIRKTILIHRLLVNILLTLNLLYGGVKYLYSNYLLLKYEQKTLLVNAANNRITSTILKISKN
mgnify:CR=1 FL=1